MTSKPRARPAELLDPAGLVVEQGVPMPPVARAGDGWSRLFERMAVGDSFQLPAHAAKRAVDWATRWGRPHGRKFAQRRSADGSAMRIWRTA